VERTIDQTTDEHVRNSNVRRPNLTRRRVKNLVQFEVASQMLPINGYWRAHPFVMQESGECLIGGDNGGMAPITEEDDPGLPLCGSASPLSITWLGDRHPYLPGTSSIYGEEPFVMRFPRTDASGATVGSVKLTTFTEYQVVAPDRIIARVFQQEEGGCTRNAEFVIELVTADEAACTATGEAPISTTPEVPPPVAEGPWRVGLPLVLDEQACRAPNVPPPFEQVYLRAQPDGSLIVDYGTGRQTLFDLGGGLYDYDSGMGGERREVISVIVLDGGTEGNLSWSINTFDGNICNISWDITLPGDAPAEPTAAPTASAPNPDNGVSGSPSDNPTGSALPGTYSVEWIVLDMACPTDLRPIAPTFTEVTITLTDTTTAVLDYGTGTYTVMDTTGQAFFMGNNDPGAEIGYNMSVFSTDANTAALAWYGFLPSNPDVTCAATAMLTRVP
jgi:hypothetical protein